MDVAVTCPGCGETLTGRTDRRYCSAACRQAAYRRRAAGDDDDQPERAKPTTVKRGRYRISMDEAMAGLALNALDDAEAAGRVFAELNLAAVTPGIAAQARDELAEAINIYRRLHRAVDAAAQGRAHPVDGGGPAPGA